jgi:hypothetical protein
VGKQLYTDLEIAMAEHASLELDSYVFWQERLREIQTAYSRSTPSSLQQYWFLRRDKVQWATLWMGSVVVVLTVVTVIFGVIQCVTAVMQLYAVYHPPAIARLG